MAAHANNSCPNLRIVNSIGTILVRARRRLIEMNKAAIRCFRHSVECDDGDNNDDDDDGNDNGNNDDEDDGDNNGNDDGDNNDDDGGLCVKRNRTNARHELTLVTNQKLDTDHKGCGTLASRTLYTHLCPVRVGHSCNKKDCEQFK